MLRLSSILCFVFILRFIAVSSAVYFTVFDTRLTSSVKSFSKLSQSIIRCVCCSCIEKTVLLVAGVFVASLVVAAITLLAIIAFLFLFSRCLSSYSVPRNYTKIDT